LIALVDGAFSLISSTFYFKIFSYSLLISLESLVALPVVAAPGPLSFEGPFNPIVNLDYKVEVFFSSTTYYYSCSSSAGFF
jgi:hypothetical protein